MVRLVHVHAVDTRPRREGPGDQATPFHVQHMRTCAHYGSNGTYVNLFAHIAYKLRLAPLYALHDTSFIYYVRHKAITKFFIFQVSVTH